MKLTIFIIACMAIVAVQTASVHNDLHVVVDKALLEKQRFIFEILYRVDHEIVLDEWIKLGGKLIIDQNLYTKYDDMMVKFYQTYKMGGLLPRGEFFGATQRNHIYQAIGLFNFFYYAKDWQTFVQNVAWARINVNEGMFVYALTMTAIHREDMQGIILPQVYEIFPQMFLSSKYIVAAEKFDWDVWNREIMLEKELKTIYQQEYDTKIIGNRFYLRDWKLWQWWKLMGIDDGWQLESQSMRRDNFQLLRKDPLWTKIYSNLKMFWIPADYSRDVGILNDDSMLSYFTEDVSWNAYWYYLNLDYSKTLIGKEFHLDKDRRGEWWIYNVQQLLARYYMERLSQGYGKFETLSWVGIFNNGYDPQLIAYNGNGFTIRPNYWLIQSYQNVDMLNKIVNLERRIDDAIATGKFLMKDGTVVDLTQPKAIEYIGNLLQGNIDLIDRYFFGYWWILSTMYLSGEEYHAFTIAPSVLINYETMLRDPLAYSLLKIAVNKFYMFKNQFVPYTHEDLLFNGVKIVDTEVSELMTFFDLVDIDVTTLLNDKMLIQDGKFIWDKTLLARQMRLNHKPFTYDIQVVSEKEQKAVVRVFLGPDFDQHGQKLTLLTNRENFMEIDEFLYDLVAGKNVIHRSSEDFVWTANDPLTYSELYNYLTTAYEGQHQFYQNISESHSLFPDRLILPHGWVEGMPMVMFFMISPYTAEYQQFATYDPTYLSGIGSGVRHIDNLPFGYPLDRKIENFESFIVPNMYFKNVNIYHLEKHTKYYPLKYENYGKFDENF